MPRKTNKNISSSNNDERKPIFSIDKPSFMNDVRAFFADERTRHIIALILMAMALFMAISYISYFTSGANDASILELPRGESSLQRNAIRNTLGLPGAVIGNLLIDGSFGIVSVLFIVMLVLYSLQLFRAINIGCLRLLFCCTFWIVWGSITLGFIQLITGIDTFFRWGGSHGETLASWINSYIHPLGVMIMILLTLFIFLIVADKHFIERATSFCHWVAGLFRKKEEEPAAEDTTSTEDITIEIDVPQNPEDTDPVTEEPSEPGFTIEISEEEDDKEDLTDQKQERQEETKEERTEEAHLDINETEEVEVVEKQLPPYDPRKDLEYYKFPTLDLLKVYDNETAPVVNQEEQQANASRIVTTLRNYGIEIDSIKATVGPTVTLYEVVPKAGVRISKIQSLENDIMLSLSAKGIRIIAPIPGKGTVGIEVPNEKPQVVSMHSVIASKRFQEDRKMRLPIAIGRTITNEVFMFDLAKTPHLLVAGATGQGKSVAINAIITSLLYKKHPAELKLVMVDPKKVEFAPYRPLLKHYLAAMPDTDERDVIITDCQKVIDTLNSLVIEMENRYELLEDAGVRNLEDYNDKFIARHLNPEKLVAGQFHHRFLPYIVIIIDEYGDFIMQAGKQVETPIARITQKARAVGMHMILATQRPSVNIVTGVIKANIPTRIALRTQSVVDSRTVLDAKGADQLIGKGDMLYSGSGEITRIQCAFVDTPEVDAIVDHISGQQHYFEPYQLPEYVGEGGDAEPLAPGSVDLKRLDPMFADVARYVVTKQEGSTSRLQRAFEIGYNRAGKLSDQLEAAGIVGPNKGPKGRDVLIQDLDALDRLLETL